MFKEKQKGAQQTSVALPQCDPYLLCGVWRSNAFIILDPSYVYGLLILPTCYRGLMKLGPVYVINFCIHVRLSLVFLWRFLRLSVFMPRKGICLI